MPEARQAPFTRTSPVHSLVSNTSGLTHQSTISGEASARNTRSGEAGISTVATSDPCSIFATARALPLLPLDIRPPVLLAARFPPRSRRTTAAYTERTVQDRKTHRSPAHLTVPHL